MSFPDQGFQDLQRRLLTQPTLTDAEADRVRTHFLLPRERLLEIIEAAGRKPNVPGGEVSRPRLCRTMDTPTRSYG